MKPLNIYLDVPPAAHRGGAGSAKVVVDGGRVAIEPFGASGSVNGGHNYRYVLEASPMQLLQLAVTVAKFRLSKRFWWPLVGKFRIARNRWAALL